MMPGICIIWKNASPASAMWVNHLGEKIASVKKLKAGETEPADPDGRLETAQLVAVAYPSLQNA